MRTNSIFYRSIAALLLLFACGVIYAASAQTTGSRPTRTTPQRPQTTFKLPEERGPAPAVDQTNLYCGGYIQYASEQTPLEIIGGEREQEKRNYGQGDYVYINAGSQQGMRAGQEFSIIRPRGQFKSKWTKKKGWLGVYMQELGQLRLTEVKDRVSVAVVTKSCDVMMLGDLLKAVPQRVAPVQRTEVALNHVINPSSKQKGRIVLARDGRELLAKDEVVFIDLGVEDQVKPGDYFTIYRRVGTPNVARFKDEEIPTSASGGFESKKFHGGKFSINGQRSEGQSDTGVYGPTVTSHEIKLHRGPLPRKVVGEMVVLDVQARTATAVITRTSEEVHTGDFVERQ